ncbi:S8 family serine peptidase [Arthrobacter sp. HY1533]|uniref:S8 family serine peptidase n=1 Tax=Arthrobacter sp. HY1533 TaxID=2970919 RepID=UPI0022B9D5D1|nr:S8 family serine peptidase [Arthrobacter sp. HY1533]
MSDKTGSTAYYYADGERVPLAPSSHFVAVRATPQDADSMVQGAAALSADPQQPVEIFRVTDQDLVVFKVAGAGVPGAAPGIMAAQAALADDAAPGPDVYEPGDGAEAANGGTPTALIDNGELIVKFGGDAATMARVLKKYRLETIQADYPEPGAVLVMTAGRADSAVALANELHELDGIDYAVPNFVRLSPRLTATLEGAARPEALGDAGPAFTPNDPLLSSQWGIAKIRCPEAWDISRGSSAITVAIIDEGGNAHEDYVQAPGFDARFNDSDPTPNPADGHGVACAGIAVGTAGNGRGIAGVAPNSRVRHVRIAYGIGGGFWSTTDAVIAAGVRRAVDLGADVLSNSWGSGASTVVTNAFVYAQTNGRGGRGTPIAAATGNGDILGVGYPARLSPVIRGFLAVGASNQWDQRKSMTSLDGETWWGSNYGPEVDVVAPGVKIPTTDMMGAGGYTSGNYVGTFNGTSSATPHVAGLMALTLAVDPELRSWEVEDIIKLTARDLGAAGRDQQFGFGRIDARAALEAASKIWYDIQVVPVFLGAGRETFLRVQVRMFNPGINTVRLNGLSFRSHAANGTVLDEFSFRGTPGPVMLARSGHDVRFANLLLRANGNQNSWSYNWSANWDYTFWRPSAPAFALGSMEADAGAGVLDESQGLSANGGTVEGSGSGGTPATPDTASAGPGLAGAVAGEPGGDRVTVDRSSREITIVVR